MTTTIITVLTFTRYLTRRRSAVRPKTDFDVQSLWKASLSYFTNLSDVVASKQIQNVSPNKSLRSPIFGQYQPKTSRASQHETFCSLPTFSRRFSEFWFSKCLWHTKGIIPDPFHLHFFLGTRPIFRKTRLLFLATTDENKQIKRCWNQPLWNQPLWNTMRKHVLKQ